MLTGGGDMRWLLLELVDREIRYGFRWCRGQGPVKCIDVTVVLNWGLGVD